MNITILSGGSGNDKLIRGLKKLYSSCSIKVITNLYDSGKSTGICRKVTNTLGVSDVRKNHSRLYETVSENVNKSILEFYNNRYDLEKGNEFNCVKKLLDNWDLNQFIEYAKRFFEREESKSYSYKNFNIANIIYSQMYSELGYENTNAIFCNLLNIDNFVICNSFDNVYLKAITEDGSIIDDEGIIVEYKNRENKIVNIFYDGEEKSLNNEAIDLVLNCDLLIISTGTFWSSIYPTLDYKNFYQYINKSKAKKIWAINNIEDKDSWGFSSNDFINRVKLLGLDLSDFTILENLDSVESLHQKNKNYSIVYKHMGNIDGKHDPEKYAREILNIYYNLKKYDKIIVDFDDTIWSRNYKYDLSCNNISVENIRLLNDLPNTTIISGNTFYSISKKLYSVFGTNLDNFNIDIWADSNCRKYTKNISVDTLDELEILKPDYEIISNDLKTKFNLDCSIDNNDKIFNIKIKPLNNLERNLLVEYFNTKFSNLGYIAKLAGTTTVDIVHINNTKLKVLEHILTNDDTVLYIGDELDSGNDKDVISLSTEYINVKNVKETNTILKLLRYIYEEN